MKRLGRWLRFWGWCVRHPVTARGPVGAVLFFFYLKVRWRYTHWRKVKAKGKI